MTITVLAENTSTSDALSAEHGLCLYIEAATHKLLFDTGASALFSVNAAKLGVNLAEVDAVMLSHGHCDHGGGLETLLELNRQARIYAGNKAFDGFYSGNHGVSPVYIGLNSVLLEGGRFVLVGDRHQIDGELEMFSTPSVLSDRTCDRGLLMRNGGGFAPDDFAHERSLILREGEKRVLLTGCAHTGITNIVERFRQIEGVPPDVIVGGFHLNHLAQENEAAVRAVGESLKGTSALCFTGHCTGLAAYDLLRDVMGDAIGYLSTGTRITI